MATRLATHRRVSALRGTARSGPSRSGARRPSRGRVIWITGLSGSGKTTVGRAVANHFRTAGRTVVLLDGDELRRSIARDLGYELADRRQCAERYARLATALARQRLIVVVATISMFDAVRRWNRRHAPRYLEVYLRGTWRPRRRAATVSCLVVGVDLPFEAPRRPHLVFDVRATDSAAIAARIVARVRHGR